MSPIINNLTQIPHHLMQVPNHLMQIPQVQTCQKFFLDIWASDLVQKIYKTVLSLFIKISEFFNTIKKFSESNLKTFGLICCFTLVIVLFIAIIRPGNRIVPFLTPAGKGNRISQELTNPNTKRGLFTDNTENK
jgi:hypothetical protein